MPATGDHGVAVEGLWKKFRRGEVHDSLRDLIPAVARKLVGKGRPRDELAEDDFWALRDVSFRVEAGEALGVIGANGAGKSTLLKILSGILRPNRGRLEIRGRLRALIEVAAGFHPDLTGRENVFLNGAILGMHRDEVAAKLDRIVDFSGIEPFMDTPVKRYSSGMMARLGFSVAAHMDPEVLLVDEILSVGDLAFQKKCYDHMRSLAERGVAVIFVSHNMSAIHQLCPRTLVLSEGAVAFLGDTAAAQHEYFSLLNPRRQAEKGLELERIEVTDPEGRARTVFEPGSPCRVRAVVRTDRDHEQFSLGLSLSTTGGTEVFHTTARRLNGATLAVRSGERVELEASLTLNLAGGTYTAYVQCHDYAGHPSEICRFEAAEIQVPKRAEWGGLSHLEPTLRMGRAGATVGLEA